jgi:hypothetical protein
MGAGGFIVEPGDAVRSGGTLTLTTAFVIDPSTGDSVQQLHKMKEGQRLYKQPVPGTGSTGQVADFGANGQGWGPSGADMVIASVVDEHTITVTDPRDPAVSSQWLNFSVECAGDVGWARLEYGIAVVRTKSGDRLYIGETGPIVPDGLSLLSGGEALPIGAEGVASTEVTADGLIILEGKTLEVRGPFVGTGWYNGGGVTQTTQRDFAIGPGGTPTSTLPIILRSWQEHWVKNDTAVALTVYPNATAHASRPGTATIAGASSFVLPPYSSARFLTNDVNNSWMPYFFPAQKKAVSQTFTTADAKVVPSPLANSWTSVGGALVAYQKLPSGLVVIEGAAQGGTINLAVFQLAVGYRPAKNVNVAVDTATGYGRLEIDTDGIVTPRSGSSTGVALNCSFMSADPTPITNLTSSLTFSHGLLSPCTDLIISKISESGGSYVPAATPDWVDNGNGTVTVRAIQGLAPLKTYTVRFICEGL